MPRQVRHPRQSKPFFDAEWEKVQRSADRRERKARGLYGASLREGKLEAKPILFLYLHYAQYFFLGRES